MKADYFDEILNSIPGVPGTEKQTGNGANPHGSNVFPAFPVFPVENETEEIRATGYGCGKCQSNNYLKVDGGWRCEGCGKVFPIIGGTKGPYYLTGDRLGYQQGETPQHHEV